MSKYICPHCKQPIYDDEALLCLYCGESLHRSIGFMGKIKYPTPRMTVTGVVIFVLVCFILLLMRLMK
jgi:hypothetical protein